VNIHEISGQSTVPPSIVSVFVSKFVSDCSFSESNNKYNPFINVSTPLIEVGGIVKRSSKDQSRPIPLEMEMLNL
jgi:hypothetical protein